MEERLLEQQHVESTIQVIQNEQELIKKQQDTLQDTLQSQLKEISDKRINTGSEEAFYESVLEYQQHEQELMLRYQTAESQEKRLKTLTTMSGNPYFARIDFTEGNEPKETLYLGISSLRDSKEETIVIDWRAPIANLYYEGELGPTFYQTDTDEFEVELLLKRQFKISDGQLLSMVDTSEVINDEFLLEILDEASSSQMKNIVSTIQKAQNQIIRDTTSKVMLIEGIAGSGKTSALLQRIAFLLYRNRKWLDDQQVLLFSPNHLFSDYIAMVLPSLGESEVPTRTFRSFLQNLLPNYEIIKEEQQEENFLTGANDRVEKLKNGLALVQQIPNYLQSITNFGPLFRDLKVKGDTYITKQQIRQWYQETNPQLPLYQRTQLLQTKILKKIGGLEKEEAKKSWVKEATREKVQEIFENDPNLEDSEENERRLFNKVRRQIVRKKFRAMTRGVNQFQFIHFPKQYLHFLKQTTGDLLKAAEISEDEWLQSIQQTRQSLRTRQLSQEDALLYTLLVRGLYPMSIEQKARFIFVDEMQDFPPAQVALLRELYPKAGMTLCGDLNQKVFGNETIVHSLDQLFPTETVARYQLTTSYRSTEEITNFANQFLSQEDQVKTTARRGPLPRIIQTQPDKAMQWLANELQDEEKNRRWRTAIICKTTDECETLYASLTNDLKEKIQLIVSEEDFMKRPIMIIPAFLAKGLEFDRVVAWNINQAFQTEQDKLVLYTIATRAMHELSLIAIETISPLLATADSTTYTTK
ncbi:RNA polymerase recycling motor HelD [Candidatus Enterococcus willemsii]|uniref:DNA helicase n=1 Tax=Candidatus Enterococcus willemsii TaxID=1857215 RepID=A0ABQ6YXW2_9ENTE|nr:RNA polymerase recycling motor HelD [Enterococcus sp. CU12B]KAF1302857.1 DNA helicase [Enterococcus sp. CU12B]